MEPSKTNQTRWEWHYNTLIFAILPTKHKNITLHALSLFICTKWTRYSTVFHWSISAMFSSNKISQHNLNSNIPYRPSSAHGLHSFCIQARQTIYICHAQYSNYIVHCSHPQHNSLPMHINMHYTPTNTHPTAFYNSPLHTTNKHKAYLAKWHKIRDSVSENDVMNIYTHLHRKPQNYSY